MPYTHTHVHFFLASMENFPPSSNFFSLLINHMHICDFVDISIGNFWRAKSASTQVLYGTQSHSKMKWILKWIHLKLPFNRFFVEYTHTPNNGNSIEALTKRIKCFYGVASIQNIDCVWLFITYRSMLVVVKVNFFRNFFKYV